MKKAKDPDKQTQNPKETFLVLDFYLCFAVLRGRDVSEMHPLCNVLQRDRKGKALHQERLSSQRPVTYHANGLRRRAKAPCTSSLQQDNIPQSISGEL